MPPTDLTCSGRRQHGWCLGDALQAVGWQEHEVCDVDCAVADGEAAQYVGCVVGVQPAYHHLHTRSQLQSVAASEMPLHDSMD